ncbi:glycosyltransferase family 2 protein [Leifsonia shinshuensis]|uniref:glycosyltransferase family 2 protein n=1 Tax=Leifsonia shinshuensis TaxID=150026 RepID=UPI00285E15CA|nr:glycosyltransferase family 2 protein [Leifsonia shinshuensis]MDR6972044.1 cellulose synthase (UDP-forming) [Leifsonia shinshuensis]
MRPVLLRVIGLLAVLAGLNYVVWRWLASVNWEAWWIAVPLVIAETYSLVDTFFFALTMWRVRIRTGPEAPAAGTADVFITTYDEPVDLVMTTASAAQRIRYPHTTWVLDDGARPEMRAAAERQGLGYITRTDDWTDKPRHAKAGNLNNALFQTEGEFLLILDADQIPKPEILDHTLGYFADPEVALVQTPQFFSNVDEADVLGNQAPLFYGPIQQGKDGWNAAFFCGSNAVLRRDALMQLGISGYVRDVENTVRTSLRAADRMLAKAARSARTDPEAAGLVALLRDHVRAASESLRAGDSVGEVTFRLREEVDAVSRAAVRSHLTSVEEDLAAIAELPLQADSELPAFVVDEAAFERLAERDWSPLGAIESVQSITEALAVDRPDEAQPVMPMATISVTEDMATAMQLHANGWRSVYHHELLATGLAPEDLGTMLKQRLRWAQGTLQVMLKDNPLLKRGLDAGQRLMYFATMWSYLAGFAAIVYLAAPAIYLLAGVMPVTAWSVDFFARFIPYFVLSQLMFLVGAHGIRTWRGQQYALALFPLWIKACWTSAANVWFKRPLGFVVTPKERKGRAPIPWREIWPQLTAMVVLVVAAIVGVLRVIAGTADGVGTLVNTVWVVYDLVVLSIIPRAALYRGPAAPALEKESPLP